MGYNYNLVGEFLSTDMTYAAGQRSIAADRTTQSPGAAIQSWLGTKSQYQDYERHLQQFNLDEYIKTETFSD
jgi:hypothetical protein